MPTWDTTSVLILSTGSGQTMEDLVFGEIRGPVLQLSRPIRAAGLLALVGALLGACSAGPVGIGSGSSATTAVPTTAVQTSAGPAGADSLTQTSEGGQVTIAATWEGEAAGPVFDVALNTHSVDLDGIDLAQSADLRADNGVEVKPAAWEAPKGGHHRSGVLTFPTTTPDGKPLIAKDTRVLMLTIRGVAGVPERVFRWELSS